MIRFGFSARHRQQIEAGRPITGTTPLRICEMFEVTMEKLVKGLDSDAYESDSASSLPKKRRKESR